ncbi:MAG: putative zinc-binding metallopeptidase [Pseudomonadota bacterium]
MRVFRCPSCPATVVFANSQCLSCGTELLYDPEQGRFVDNGAPCANRAEIGCNWRAEGDGGADGLCRSCAMTEVIPDTFHGDNCTLWAEAELAKRRVLENLGRWGWFMAADRGLRPRFHMLSEEAARGEEHVTMGHADGLITINVTEADILQRIERGLALGEKLRTMVGHFRHELAHFLFDRLTAAPSFTDAFRALMGDERTDYAAALQAHYKNGPPAGWEARCITPYASAHPHEDWAETVTHLLHLADITDSAVAAGLRSDALEPGYDAYADEDAERVISRGSHVAISVNHINRAMGIGDIYPFVLTSGVREKLAFAHRWLRTAPQPAQSASV